MLKDYIGRVLSKAEYNKLEDGTFFGKISVCVGFLAFGTTMFECENELRAALEGWLIVKIRVGDVLPAIDGFDINKGISSGNGVAEMSFSGSAKVQSEVKLKRYHALLNRISKCPEVDITPDEIISSLNHKEPSPTDWTY